MAFVPLLVAALGSTGAAAVGTAAATSAVGGTLAAAGTAAAAGVAGAAGAAAATTIGATAAATTASTALGWAAAIGAVGAIYQGQAAGAQADAAASAAEANARTARQQSSANEDTQRRQNRMQQGDMRALAVESGFDPSGGSLLSLQSKNAGELELDALTGRYEGELQALNFRNEAAGLRSQAKAARRSGYLNAAGSLAAGASSYYSGQQIRSIRGVGG